MAIYHYTTIDLNYVFFHQIYIDISMIYALLMFLTMLKMLRFKSSVLFGTHTLLDKSFSILQLPIYLSNLTTNG